MLLKHALRAWAIHRVRPTIPAVSSIHHRAAISSSFSHHRAFQVSSQHRKWEGSQPKDHVTNEGDSNNVQHDAEKDGMAEKARSTGDGGEESRGTGEGAGGSNEKAKEEFPEAPDTIGMQDERGGKQ